ncbi:hypothetical protein SALBM217S_05515 [Streptomyces griseoloalbus]
MTDHRGRLVGVVSRSDLLRALIRDDDEIRTEVASLVVLTGAPVSAGDGRPP